MKTLKDFECSNNSDYSCCMDQGLSGNPHAVSTEDLREVAREWIKYFNENKHNCLKGLHPKDVCCCDESNERWITHFFNLEKEKQ